MKPGVVLTVTCLISILLLSLHIAEDIVLGFSPGGRGNLGVILSARALRSARAVKPPVAP